MFTILGSLLGFVTSTGPGIFAKIMDARQDTKDKEHELNMISQASSDRSEEAIITSIGDANVEIQKTVQTISNNSSQWVNNICALIRPVMCIFFVVEFFLLTILLAFQQINVEMYRAIWSPETSGIFASIVAFYFGNRLVQKWK